MGISESGVSSPSGVSEGYLAIREGVAVLDLSTAGKVRLSGVNARQFLNGLVSNEVKTLRPGDGVLVAFPTLKARLMALARVYCSGEDGALLLEVDRINREKVFGNLSRFVAAGGFFVEDVSDSLGLLSLQGPRASALLSAAAGRTLAADPEYRTERLVIDGTEVLAASHRRCGEEGWDLFVASDHLPALREVLIAIGDQFGARVADDEALETARIEAGVPREGFDAGEEYIILETGLSAAISYTKGCYLGQEVIAKIHWRGQPAKQLRGLVSESEVLPPPGSGLWVIDDGSSDNKVGQITSSTFSPQLGRPVALGYVHRNFLQPGTRLEVRAGEERLGVVRVAALPFSKVSESLS